MFQSFASASEQVRFDRRISSALNPITRLSDLPNRDFQLRVEGIELLRNPRGFSDQVLYKDVSKSMSRESLPVRQVLQPATSYELAQISKRISKKL